MGSLARRVPKPLLEIAGRPLLDYVLDSLGELDGLETVHVVSNARHAPAFRAWAAGRDGEAAAAGLELQVHDDGTDTPEDRLGAVGDLRFVLERIGRPRGALVSAGDNLFRFSLAPLWRRFRDGLRSRGAEAPSVVLALEEGDADELRRTGVLELDGDRVLRLHEKPEDPPSAYACPSCYALSGAALGAVGPYLDAGRPADEIGRFVAHLVQSTEVEAVRLEGERLHVGNPEELRRADRVMRGS